MNSAKSSQTEKPAQLTVREILVKARELISDPSRWTQGESARDKNGEATFADVSNSDAVCWCAMGSIWQSVGYDGNAQARAVNALKEQVGCDHYGVAEYNDSHTHAEVLALFDSAIEAAQ